MKNGMIRVQSCKERNSIYMEPVSGFRVPFDGIDVVDSPFWRRRIAAGDVILVSEGEISDSNDQTPPDQTPSILPQSNQENQSQPQESETGQSASTEEQALLTSTAPEVQAEQEGQSNAEEPPAVTINDPEQPAEQEPASQPELAQTLAAVEEPAEGEAAAVALPVVEEPKTSKKSKSKAEQSQ